MANMSYCAVENTASDVGQVLDLMGDYDSVEEWVASLGEYEKNSLPSLIRQCREIVELIDQSGVDITD